MKDNQWNSTEGITISMTDRDTLSYADQDEEFVLICVGNEVYKAEVWEDSEMDNREYVIVNHTIEYLDTMSLIETTEEQWDSMLLQVQND